GSCSLFGSVPADVFREENCPGDQKYHGSGGVSAVPAGEEAAVGRGILVGWAFCEYGGQARRRGEDRKVRAEPGTDIQKTSWRPAVKPILICFHQYPAACCGDFLFGFGNFSKFP